MEGLKKRREGRGMGGRVGGGDRALLADLFLYVIPTLPKCHTELTQLPQFLPVYTNEFTPKMSTVWYVWSARMEGLKKRRRAGEWGIGWGGQSPACRSVSVWYIASSNFGIYMCNGGVQR